MAQNDGSNNSILIIISTLIIGIIAIYISSTLFYQKSEVYSKSEMDDLLTNKLSSDYYTKNQVENLIATKPTCKYFNFMFAGETYFGQTPRSICQKNKLEPQILFVRSIATVSNDGVITYVDEESYSVSVDGFDLPLGKAADIPREYGRPDSVYKGSVNQNTAGLLCC